VEGLDNFEIIDDPILTNRDFTSFRNTETGEVVFSVRGSDADFWKPDANIDSAMRGKGGRWKNIGDWNTNLKTASGKAHESLRYIQAEAAYERLSELTGTPFSEMKPVGHSLGGGLAKHLAKKYGSKSVVFDPAEHPFLTPLADEIHEGYGNTTYRPFGDGVSLGEVSKGRGHPNSVVKNMTALPGTEHDFMAHHDMEQMIRRPAKIGENGELIQVRTTKARNVAGLAGANTLSKGLSTAIMVAPTLAFEPEYASEGEKTYRRGVDLPVDLMKYEVEMGGISGLTKLAGEGGIPVDVPGVMGQLFVQEFQDVKGYHDVMKAAREPIFGKDPDYRVEDYSPGIKFLQDIFNPSHSRQNARNNELYTQQTADEAGMSYNDFIAEYGTVEEYYRQIRIEEGLEFEPIRYTTAELANEQIQYEAEKAAKERFEATDPYAHYQAQLRNQHSFQLGGGMFDYDEAERYDEEIARYYSDSILYENDDTRAARERAAEIREGQNERIEQAREYGSAYSDYMEEWRYNQPVYPTQTTRRRGVVEYNPPTQTTRRRGIVETPPQQTTRRRGVIELEEP